LARSLLRTPVLARSLLRFPLLGTRLPLLLLGKLFTPDRADRFGNVLVVAVSVPGGDDVGLQRADDCRMAE
jgi:hypothetical protein